MGAALRASFVFSTLKFLGKTASDHFDIITAALQSSAMLYKDVLVFSGTTDNEPAVALGVDRYLAFGGSVRCLCQTRSQAVNDAVTEGEFLSTVLRRIGDIANS